MIDELTDTQKFRLTELESLRQANARLVMENRLLRELVRFGQSAVRSAAGNLTAYDARARQFFDDVVK